MKKSMMISTILISVGGLCGNVLAVDMQCNVPPSCADLGYKEASCPNNNGIKCPWGEAWYCPPDISEICKIGSILYSDMTCSTEAKSGKTPIGVVVYVDGTGAGQAMSLKSIGSYKWATEAMDISGLTYYNSAEAASQDVSSCENSKIIMAAGDKDTYPAVWAANEYKTEGTSAGDWCLPAAGIFTSYYNNKDIINTGFDRAGGTKYTGNTWVWSSSMHSYNFPWGFSLVNNYGLSSSRVTNLGYVHPVFEFVQTVAGICKGSFKYTCLNEEYSGGVGDACYGRYEECTCADGYIRIGSECKLPCETGSELGYILYSDMTRSAEFDESKTPIGVVVCSYANGGGQALALNPLTKSYQWGGSGTDIPELTNYSSLSAFKDFASCDNSQKIMETGNKSTYPAVWAANEYKTEGTSAGDWCLPASQIFTLCKNYQDLINSGLDKVGGEKITSGTHFLSSTEASNIYTRLLSLEWLYGGENDYKSDSNPVRPVIEFQ